MGRDAVKSALEESRKEVKRMRDLKDDAQQFLLDCLDDARTEFSVQLSEKTKDWKSDEPIPWSLKGLSKVGREALLEYLLTRMGGSSLLEKSRSGRNSGLRIRSDSPSLGKTAELNKEEGSTLPPITGANLDGTQSPSVMGTWGAKGYPKQQSASRNR